MSSLIGWVGCTALKGTRDRLGVQYRTKSIVLTLGIPCKDLCRGGRVQPKHVFQ